MVEPVGNSSNLIKKTITVLPTPKQPHFGQAMDTFLIYVILRGDLKSPEKLEFLMERLTNP